MEKISFIDVTEYLNRETIRLEECHESREVNGWRLSVNVLFASSKTQYHVHITRWGNTPDDAASGTITSCSSTGTVTNDLNITRVPWNYLVQIMTSLLTLRWLDEPSERDITVDTTTHGGIKARRCKK